MSDLQRLGIDLQMGFRELADSISELASRFENATEELVSSLKETKDSFKKTSEERKTTETKRKKEKKEEVSILPKRLNQEINKMLVIFKDFMNKYITTPKVKKVLGKMGGLFKSMMGASPQAYVIQKIFETLSPLLDLLDVFQPILDAISALLATMTAEAMKPLLDIIMPLVPLIMELSPIFAKIGATLGELMATSLQPILTLIMSFMPVLEPLLDVFNSLLTVALVPMQSIMQILLSLIEPLIPMFNQWAVYLNTLVPLINTAAIAIQPFFDWLTQLITGFNEGTASLGSMKDVFMNWIQSLSMGSEWMENLKNKFIGFITNAIQPLIDLINNIIGIFIGGASSIENFGTIFKGVFENITGLVSNSIQNLFGNVKTTIENIGGAISRSTKGFVESIKEGIEKLTGKESKTASAKMSERTKTAETIKKYFGGSSNVAKNIRKNILKRMLFKRLGRAQEGGTISAPTIVGEFGKKEEVIPLEKESIVLGELRNITFETQQTRILMSKMLEYQERQRLYWRSKGIL